MKTLGLIVLVVLSASLCSAQSAGKQDTENGFMSWVHDAWKTVQDQGRPAAERIAREFPKRFQAVKQEVADLNKRAHSKISEMDLEQKKNLIVELWRVRKSLDLLTLLRPEVLHSLTGLDTTALAALEMQAKNTLAFVQAALPKQ